jgi:prepilin-type N-terminal cleavage/methylation domain-containing protein
VLQRGNEGGFTLIELMVVTAVTGFLVIAATGMMVSFAKFKYMADVQEQLKAEVSFAADQIDLLIRNSNGLPDICLASYREANDPANTVKFCDGTPQYVNIPFSEQTSNEGLNNGAQLGTDATKVVCTNPAASNITTGKDSLNTAPGTWDPNSGCIPEYAGQVYNNQLCTNSNGPYRWNDNCGGTLPSANEYMVVQVRKTIPSGNDVYKPTNGTANQYYIASSMDRGNPPLAMKLYNQIVFLVSASADSRNSNESEGEYPDADNAGQSNQYKIAIFEYQLGINGASTDPRQTLCEDVPEVVRSLGDTRGTWVDTMQLANPDSTHTYRTFYLTSNAVDVVDLAFDCKLANYGLPSQSAAITYTITIRKKKKNLNDLYDKALLDPNASAGDRANSYDLYTLTRTVNVRNSAHPFVFSQTGQS